MTTFSLNNPNTPNDLPYADVLGFDNVPKAPRPIVPQGQGIQTLPHPADDEVIDHSNTIPMAAPNGTPGGRELTEQIRR